MIDYLVATPIAIFGGVFPPPFPVTHLYEYKQSYIKNDPLTANHTADMFVS